MHEVEIKQLKKDIQDHIKQLQAQKKNLKKTVEDKKQLKSELDSIDSSMHQMKTSETIKLLCINTKQIYR